MYERVLIPLDGSPPAETILPFAEEIARSFEAEVVLLTVVEPLAPGAGLVTGPVNAADALFLHQLETKKYLAELTKRLEARGLRARPRLGLGRPAVEIVQAAMAEGADLIAMTTHGRSGLQRAVFGSVAEQVLRTAPVPVLMIRTPGPTADAKAHGTQHEVRMGR
jgi:nucleotide-binding universal stress UspA family protein